MIDLQAFFRFRDRDRAPQALAIDEEPLLLTDFVDDDGAPPHRVSADPGVLAVAIER